MKILFFLFLLTSCAPQTSNIKSSNFMLNFTDELSFNEFNQLLIEYAKISPYPDIDK